MPLVVDSLVVEFGLDPTKFSEGQQEALDKLRKLETGAEDSARNVERSGGRLALFFGGFSRPLENAHRQLGAIGDQSRRMGQSVAAGAATGSDGLKALATAGLAAFAAV